MGLASALVVGVGAALPALPSLAAEPVHVDDAGYLELPAPLVSPGDYAFDFLTCPQAPPTQGEDVYVYTLPEDVAVAGAPVTISGTDGAGEVDITAYVYNDDCGYERVQRSSAALSFALEETDRHLAVVTAFGVGTTLLLEVGAPVATVPSTDPSPSASATAEPTSGPVGGPVRRNYSGGVNDPYYPEASTGPVGALATGGQWGMRIVRAEQAWQEPRATGAGVTVAVLDSGMDIGHPDFACEGKIARVTAPRFVDVTDTNGHGTHVAGIVGACTNNGAGVVGVAPDATLMPVQALSPTEATAERLGAAIDAAVTDGAHVINMSLGFSALGLPATGSAIALVGGFASTVDPAIKRAVDAGVVVVAAAGNESVPLCGYPAIARKVVCVGSSDRRDLNAWYGNFPVTPAGTSLLAPGGSGQVFCDVHAENVLSTYSRQAPAGCQLPAPGYKGLNGTSMAAPHVAGVAALVYDRLGANRSAAAAAQVVQALKDGAVDLYTSGYDPMSGDGRVDALGAVQAVSAVQPSGTPTPSPTQTAGDRSTSTTLMAPATGQTSDEYAMAARVEDDRGNRVNGAEVTFTLTGEGGTREATATTGEDGVASTSLRLDLPPGSYRLSATYAGRQGSHAGSSDSQPVEVVRDDSTTTLAVDGRGANRTLTVNVTDEDTPQTGLAGVPVVLFADGREIDTVTTDENGQVSYSPQGSARSAKTYEARFAGNDHYRGSSDSKRA